MIENHQDDNFVRSYPGHRAPVVPATWILGAPRDPPWCLHIAGAIDCWLIAKRRNTIRHRWASGELIHLATMASCSIHMGRTGAWCRHGNAVRCDVARQLARRDAAWRQAPAAGPSGMRGGGWPLEDAPQWWPHRMWRGGAAGPGGRGSRARRRASCSGASGLGREVDGDWGTDSYQWWTNMSSAMDDPHVIHTTVVRFRHLKT